MKRRLAGLADGPSLALLIETVRGPVGAKISRRSWSERSGVTNTRTVDRVLTALVDGHVITPAHPGTHDFGYTLVEDSALGAEGARLIFLAEGVGPIADRISAHCYPPRLQSDGARSRAGVGAANVEVRGAALVADDMAGTVTDIEAILTAAFSGARWRQLPSLGRGVLGSQRIYGIAQRLMEAAATVQVDLDVLAAARAEIAALAEDVAAFGTDLASDDADTARILRAALDHLQTQLQTLAERVAALGD